MGKTKLRRTETQGYRFPPANPVAPSPLLCTTEDLHQLALDAATGGSDLQALCNSPAHVRALCAWAAGAYPKLNLVTNQLAVEQGIAAALQSRLDAEVGACDRVIARVVALHEELVTALHRLHAEQEQALEWQRQCVRLSGENVALSTEAIELQARFAALTQTVCGRPYSVVNAELASELDTVVVEVLE